MVRLRRACDRVARRVDRCLSGARQTPARTGGDDVESQVDVPCTRHGHGAHGARRVRLGRVRPGREQRRLLLRRNGLLPVRCVLVPRRLGPPRHAEHAARLQQERRLRGGVLVRRSNVCPVRRRHERRRDGRGRELHGRGVFCGRLGRSLRRFWLRASRFRSDVRQRRWPLRLHEQRRVHGESGLPRRLLHGLLERLPVHQPVRPG